MSKLALPAAARLRGRWPTSVSQTAVATTAVLAASFGYALHHIEPFGAHAAETILVGVALASVLAVGLSVGAAARSAPALPDLLVAGAGRHDTTLATRSELGFLGALHTHELEQGFFVSLGPGFLRVYHATFLDSPHAVALVSTLDDHRVGALMGVLDAKAHRRWLLRHRALRVACAGAIALITRPAPALRFARTRVARYVRGLRPSDADRSSEPRVVGVLSHVAVVPGVRGMGAGRRLVQEFADRARQGGAEEIVLVTVEGCSGAGGFYARLGWSASGVLQTADGQSMRRWRLPLARSS